MEPARRAQHGAAGGAGHVDGALQVEVDHLVERVVAEEPDHALACHASVVHQHVEVAPALGGLRARRVAACSASETSAVLKWKRSLYSGSSSQARTASVGRARARRDAVARIEKGLYQAGAEPLAAAGDEGDAVGRLSGSSRRPPHGLAALGLDRLDEGEVARLPGLRQVAHGVLDLEADLLDVGWRPRRPARSPRPR